MKSRLGNRIWNRDILDWLNLLFAVVNLIILLNTNNRLRYLNAIVAGMCFMTWLYGSFFNKLFARIRRSDRFANYVSSKYKELEGRYLDKIEENLLQSKKQTLRGKRGWPKGKKRDPWTSARKRKMKGGKNGRTK